MGEIIKINNECADINDNSFDVVEIAEGLVFDARKDLSDKNKISMPIAELATLGAGVSSLIPALRTVTESVSIDMQGLFRVANAAPGDILKVAKNGNCWGALKTADGASKMAQLAKAEPLTATTSTVSAINPATMMMAVALFSIEQQLVSVEETQKRILRFMEYDKESKIEGDVEQLMSIISKYKHNWDNDLFVSNNHKMVNDIQRSAREQIIYYQKEVSAMFDSKKTLVAKSKVKSMLDTLLKKFKYYRLSLYIFSLSSLLEIMLSGNFKEENINGIKNEIEKMSIEYREVFEKCSVYLERMGNSAIEMNLLRGVGAVSELTGKAIGAIPVINKGPVDEFLQDNGEKIKKNAESMERDILKEFAEISNPETGIFTSKMSDMIKIYNHTSDIYFDKKQIYLIEEA